MGLAPSTRFTEVSKIIGINLVVILVLLSAAELIVRHLMTTPAQIPSGAILDAMRTLYWRQRDRDLIQFSRECAQHDNALGYTLRPGHCTFSGPEFSNTYSVNSLGLRDDEMSIVAPTIIVLGDSHAMGWGVDQDKTFAQLIESRRKTVVLNAAVSSYGTAREFMNLQRLDTSRLRTLIVQYDDNDIPENRAFYENGDHLDTMSANAYATLTLAREKLSQYYFGKELRQIARGLVQTTIVQIEGARAAKEPDGSAARRRPPLNEAELFLHVLDHSGDAKLNAVEIIAVDISNYGRSGHRFFNSLQSTLREGKSPLNLKLLDAGTILGPEHYYRLDGHLNAEGHRVLADAILGVMTAP